LLAMSVAAGLQLMADLMDDEVSATVGAKHARLADRTAVRHASTTGSLVLGDRKVAVRPPTAGTRHRWAARCSWLRMRRSPQMISSSRWCWSACWQVGDAPAPRPSPLSASSRCPPGQRGQAGRQG
jgi:hypothetical protein